MPVQVYDLDDFLSRQTVRQDIIAEGILIPRSKLVIGGAPKLGKTKLASQMAYELASGAPFLGLFDIPRPYSVLIVQQEISEDSYRERLAAARGTVGGIMHGVLGIAVTYDLQIDTPAGRGELHTLVTNWKPDVVIFDPLYKMHSSNEDSASEIQQRVFNPLDKLINDTGISVIIVHHKKKPTVDARGRLVDHGMFDLRGSIQVAAWADSVLTLTEHPNQKDLIVLSFWLRHGVIDPVILTPVKDKFTFTAQPQGQPTTADEQAAIAILQGTGRKAADYQTLLSGVKAKTGHSDASVKRAISTLRKKALIGIAGTGRAKRSIYLLSSPRDQWFLLE